MKGIPNYGFLQSVDSYFGRDEEEMHERIIGFGARATI